MNKRILYSLLFMVALLSSTMAYAQKTMVVFLKNGGTLEIPVSNISKMTWESMGDNIFNDKDSVYIDSDSISNDTIIQVVEKHEYVDLGLPSGTLWATCNVGATSPEEYGDYFAWGETEPKNQYNWSTYKWCRGTYDTMTKYCTSSSYGTVDNKTTLELEDDAAHVNWGGDWRMPTIDEINELRNSIYCNWTWTTQNGVNGYKVTSKSNGNSLFLPAAGYRGDTYLYFAGSDGGCWSSSLYSGCIAAYYLEFGSSGNYWNGGYRYYGFSVRPVLGGLAQNSLSPITPTK